MKRYHIINELINKHGFISYLEIGCQLNQTFNAVDCQLKVGVDPERGGTNRETSDAFFANNKMTFDIIFIDGLHTAEQVLKDIENALKFLNPKGVIVCHDMNPETELIQRVPMQSSDWSGDCWKAFVKLRQTRKDLTMSVINTDYGVGVIRPGSQELLSIDEELTYEGLDRNRVKWLNLLSIEEAIEKNII